MAKKTKDKTGRVVMVTKEDNLLLKQYFLDAEEVGCTLSNAEICNQIFSRGLHVMVAETRNTKTKEKEVSK